MAWKDLKISKSLSITILSVEQNFLNFKNALQLYQHSRSHCDSNLWVKMPLSRHPIKLIVYLKNVGLGIDIATSFS